MATYGYSLDRQGANRSEHTLTPQRVARLHTVWRAKLPGAVNTQPLVARRVRIGKRTRDVVLVASEHGQVAALDAHSGRAVWRRRLGAREFEGGCWPGPDSKFGVSGTLALDRGAGRVYAVDGRGRAFALSLATGRTRAGWPVQVARPGTAEYVWSALALARGRLYVPVASPCDAGDYRGGVTAIDTRNPRRTIRWEATAGTPFTGGAVWGWGGVSIDSGGDVYAATGNSNGSSEDAGYSERVVRLSSDLVPKAADNPLIGPFTLADRDFGTTPVLFHAQGCPAQLVALNKNGELFVYDRDAIGAGPTQRLAVAAITERDVPLIGVPSYDANRRMLVLLTPRDATDGGPQRGILGLHLGADCRFAFRWRTEFDRPASGSQPTLANGVAYVADGRKGLVRAYAVGSGRCVWSHKLNMSTFANPTVAGGTVYAADWSGTVWAFRAARRRASSRPACGAPR